MLISKEKSFYKLIISIALPIAVQNLITFAVSMIIAAIGLLIYCAGFYIKSYEQNLAARQEYAELSKMAGVKNRAGAGLLADGLRGAGPCGTGQKRPICNDPGRE